MSLRLLPALVIAVPLVAAAQGADVEIARAHFRTAQQYYQRDRFLDAAREFEEAYRLSQKGEILYNIAKSYDGARDIVRARDYYWKYLMAIPESSDRASVSHRVNELQTLIATVRLRVSPDGAQVSFDGQPVGTSPMKDAIEVNPGKHKLEVSREGWKTYSRELEVAAAARLEVEAKLQSLSVQVVVMQEKPTPTYKKWWVWTLVGAVVVAAAVTGGVLGARAAESGEVESPIPVAR
jgi:tetratricopeptide (TPR) repeat protein